jgi:hypothetical protein
MATTTLNTLLPEFAKRNGFYVGSFTTTTDVTGSDKVITSTGLINSGYDDDDSLIDYWIRITSGTDDDAIRRVDDYTGSTGSCTVASGGNLSSGSSVTFEVYTRDPQEIIDALNSARTALYPSVHQVIYERDVTGETFRSKYPVPSTIHSVSKLWYEPRIQSSWADNLVENLDSDFEGDLSDFTATNATLSVETETNSPNNQMVWDGTQSGKIVVANGNTGYVSLTIANPSNYEGQEINVSLWVHALTVSGATVKAAVRIDGGSWTVGTGHGGDGWERLSVSTSPQGINTSIDVGLEIVNSTGADYHVYADELVATAGRTENAYPQARLITNWYPEGANVVIPAGVPENTNLLFEGVAPLSSVNAGTDTMEIGANRYEILFQSAMAVLTSGEFQESDDGELNTVQRRNTHARNRIQENTMVVPTRIRTVV